MDDHTGSGVVSPEEFLGFRVGDDRRLASWSQVAEYFHLLGDASDRVQTAEIGVSTEGNPVLLSIVSSAANLDRLDLYRDIQARLADPRGIRDGDEADTLITDGKVVVLVTCGIHAIEVGATQMSMLLGHHLATSEDESVLQILDNVILLLVPSVNPDGLVMVKDWYDETVGSRYEGVSPPFLYQKYTGHDNNRDWFMLTQAETRLMVEQCLNPWRPQIVCDLHQTRSTGMRMILPPFVDPVDQNVDPLLQSQVTSLGSSMASTLTAEGKAGVAVNLVYDAFSPSRTYAHYHGGVRVLSETASARIATPIELTEADLKAARGEEPTIRSWNHPMPWKGGRWGLREIVDYQLYATIGCLDHASRNRDTWLRNFYRVGAAAVSQKRAPDAFLVPREQRDSGAAEEMLNVLRDAGVEIHEARSEFAAGGRRYPAGTGVILTAQPYGAFARTMLQAQRYPDLRTYSGGPPKAPYDVTAHILPSMMGVEVSEADGPLRVALRPRQRLNPSEGAVVVRSSARPTGYMLGPESNAGVRAVNRLMAAGARVGRLKKRTRIRDAEFPPGAYLIDDDPELEELISSVARQENVTLEGVSDLRPDALAPLRRPRIGLYRSYVPTAEEGWTRFVLEEYGFEYTSLVDEDVKRPGLSKRFDAIVLPHQRAQHLLDGHNSNSYPPQYSGGIGMSGTRNLKDFVQQGGTLIAWDGAAEYAMSNLDLPVTNALAGVPKSEFYAPGSLLRVDIVNDDPLGYGLPEQCAVMFLNGPAFEMRSGRAVGRYPRKDQLLAGWLIGGEKLGGRVALAAVSLGKGEVVLMGFRPHFRAQMRGTYRVLFNALLNSAATSETS